MGSCDQAALELGDAMVQLGDDAVDGDEPVGRRRLGSHDVSVPVDRHLADFTVGDARVALLEEMDLGAVHPFEDATDPRQLVLDAVPQRFGDLDVASADGDVHTGPPGWATATRHTSDLDVEEWPR